MVDPALGLTTTRALEGVHETFRRWLGDEYDLGALDAVLATAAAERLTGDPLWLLLISGSGNAKTETVQSLAGAGAIVTSTITSEGALLSGTPKPEVTSDATGGLLRRIGGRGILIIKDMTSILSMNRDTRSAVLAAFREIHDGRWERNIGASGGRTLCWTGRLVIVGACTTAWDRAHDVIASMGDRFVVVRMDSTRGRLASGHRAIANTGQEDTMRAELSMAVGALLAMVEPGDGIHLTSDEEEHILTVANIVTLARTGVEYDYRGNVIDAHAPEMPTRFAKQLGQILRGAVALGLPRPAALKLAIRCARDSMPPLRLAILDDVAANPGTLPEEVRQRLAKPRTTVERQLASLHMLDLLSLDAEQGDEGSSDGKPAKIIWTYSVKEGIDPSALGALPEMSPHGDEGK
jgi:hypothetical protein